MLEWKKLLSPVRRKSLYDGGESMNVAVGRLEAERDFDRILFAAPTRRLADKTQVFPMEENDSVRNRLTHSHEVSNLARSIGVRLAFDHASEVFGSNHEELGVNRSVPALLAAVGLAHDLGNPPFGHQGEIAIQQWFSKHQSGSHDDFKGFDGNAQTLRLLTRLQVLNDSYGLNLTFGTLAALIKYPSLADSDDRGGFKKFGVFESEREIIADVWSQTGLSEGVRHPLAYVMEACDDIAYSIIDAEDTVKKGYASFYDLIDYLESFDRDDQVIKRVVEASKKKNFEFRSCSLSSRELDEVSMQMFRVKAIAEMIPSATEVFIENVKKMLDGSISPGFELIKNSASASLCKAAKRFDAHYGFAHRDVLKLELDGNSYIKSMMSMLWKGIVGHREIDHAFDRYVFGEISENYRRVYAETPQNDYHSHQLLCDAISGMTENYLIKKHNDLKALENACS